MNKVKLNSKRIISVVLALLLAFSCLAVVSFAADTEKVNPTIYIKGQGSNLTADGTRNGEEIYPVSIPDGYIGDRAKELIAPLSKAMLTGDWEDYNQGLYEAIMPVISRPACDENGDVVDGSGSKWSSSTKAIPIQVGSSVMTWTFDYDWRLDPVECVDSLHDYINFVKTKTGSEKVNIIARCLGTNIILAYEDKYGMADIDKCLLCCSGFEGFETMGAIFAGEIKFDSSAIERFSDTYLAVDEYADDPSFEIMRLLVTAIDATPILSFTADTANSFFKNIKDDAWKRLLRDSYATMPSFWSYFGDDYYEAAKAYVFGGEEEKYAGLIAKIDNFHYNILSRYDELLDKAEADGVKFYNVVKYGFQMIPVLGADFEMSDTLISTSRSSIGAVCSTVDGQLSKSYLASADAKYISPDKQVDASTAKYADHTWFIKNMSHRFMPETIDLLFGAIIEAPGYATVDEVEGYPQFLMSSDDGSVIEAATEDNTQVIIDRVNENPLVAFIKAIIRIFKMIFGNLFTK